MKAKFILIILFVLANVLAMAQVKRYVRPVAAGSGNGSSWDNASSDLQAMINASGPANEVWVATGTYYPTNTTDRTISFTMKPGVIIYGGFPNSPNATFAHRNIDLFETILSGDIDKNDGPNFANNSGNSYHVVNNSGNGLTNTAVLDGFTITGGNANGPIAPYNLGGGIYNTSSSPTLRNITFRANNANLGGGMYNEQASTSLINVLFVGNNAVANGGGAYNTGSSTPSFTSTTFSGNTAVNGGGLYNSSSTPTLSNIAFSGNTGNLGGGMYSEQSAASISNAIFSGNNGNLGGGMYNIGSPSPSIFNATFWDNNATQGGAIYNNAFNAATPTVKNSIFWGNTTGGSTINNFAGNTTIVTYSDIQGGFAGTGNTNQDPLFINAANPSGADGKPGTADDGLNLLHCSPLINLGNNTGVASTDVLGNARIVGAAVDMGAFEYQGTGTRLYVNAAAPANGSGSSWGGAYQDLQTALAAASACSNINEIWVAKGIYYPTATTNRSISFVLKNGISIYGGFPNTGNPGLANRDFAANETILSGDIDKNDGPNFANNSGNSYHVVSNNNNGVNSTALLDGFTITGGNANAGTSPNNSGGGMLNSSATPKLVNIIFSGNAATQGGGIFNSGASLSLANVIFSGNTATTNGGGMLNISCAPTLSNAIFSGNTANQGGGIANSNGSPNIINATFFDNNAGSTGGGMFSFALSSPTLKNSIFWGNTVGGTTVSSIGGDVATITYSDIEGGYAGTGNINQDPLFFNAANPAGADGKFTTVDDGLSIIPCSSVLNIGNNTGVPGTDLLGNPRIFNATADMGAYECQYFPASSTVTRAYVNAAAAPNGNGSSWAAAYTDLQTALTSVRFCSNITEIWVAKGTYKPTPGTDRNISFEMVSGIKVYGSFAGTETALTERTAAVMAANPSILSGDIDGVPDVVTGSGSTLSITGNDGNSYHVVYSNNVNANTRLDGFIISGGSGSNRGGGMYNVSSAIRVYNITFTGNQSSSGGGMFNDNTTVQLRNVNFLRNIATGGGGGLSCIGINNTNDLDTVNFTGNRSTAGGGMSQLGTDRSYLTQCNFSGNYANTGGAFYTVAASFEFSEVNLINNTANIGGGVHAVNCHPRFYKVVFSGNNATLRGGGLNVEDNSYVNMQRCFFENNTSGTGGGMKILNSGFFDFSNVVFTGNHATDKGGAIYWDNLQTIPGYRYAFMTFSRNTAVNSGGANYFTGTGPRLYYSVFWGNRVGTTISNFANNAISSSENIPGMSLLYCLVEGFDIRSAIGGVVISQDPYFVDADHPAGPDNILGTADDGLALSNCSPAIDYQVEEYISGIYTDIVGNPRQIFSTSWYDIGAYENGGVGRTLPDVYTEKTQDVSDTLFIDTGCKIMAKIVPNASATGTNVLSGNVQVQEWIEPNTFNMVRRHYQITPANNAATAKGRVTLYFTIEDFAAYNANGNGLDLPAGGVSGDYNNTDSRIANIEIVKYSGTSPNGLPGGYPAQTPVIIPNSALFVWWEGKYWSVSFDVTGFSGFFVKASDLVLPLTLLSFEGKATATGNLLNWKTEREVNFSHFEIERSMDARQFEKIGTQASDASGNYALLDVSANASASYYYRLKMVDRDGKYTYSKTIRINNTGKAIVGQPYPNPTAGMATVEVSTVEKADWTFSVTDIMGRVLHTFTKNLSKGTHAIRFDQLPQGVSYIKIESGDVQEYRKIIRQ